MAPVTLALSSPAGPQSTLTPWTTPDQLADCTASDDVDLESVCAVATELLFILSGRKFGIRTETVRPVNPGMTCGWWDPVSGYQYTWDPTSGAVNLRSPVQRIISVKVDGSTLPGDQYRLFDHKQLVRLPTATGAQPWPTTQRLDMADTEIGTFSVTYEWGVPVSLAAQAAATSFACELAKYVAGDQDCQLSDRVVSINRQGVAYGLMDPSEFVKLGRTGLYLPDIWLATVNPSGSRKRPSISSPDSVHLAKPS